MRTIWLTKGQVAFVDDEDFERIAAHNWYFQSAGHDCGYAARTDQRGEKKLFILMHREIMAPAAGCEVDHMNGDGLDNRRANLRTCTHAQNMRNRRQERKSRFKGVTHRTGCKSVYAEIGVGGRSCYLGAFPTEEAAARAYDKAAKEHYGEFARLNFPENDSAAA